jgi:hypothetical protein
MKGRLIVAWAYLLVAAFAVERLWRFWTTRCNEACSSHMVIAIYLALLCFIVGSVVLVVLTCFRQVKLMNIAVFSSAFVVMASVAAVVITRLLNA